MKRRTLIVGVAAVAVVGSGVTATVLGFTTQPGNAAEPSGLPPQTAEVVTTTLRDTGTIGGTLGYGDAVPVTATGKGGTITWLAPVGSTVERGKPLYKVDERPVVSLYGKLPLYRELRSGSSGTVGDDVKQLERNLSKLGYTGFTVDEYFTAGTAAAVAEWQEDIGQQATGVLMPGEAVFVPSAVRIADHAARVGAAAGGEVLSYTGTAREVTVELEVADQRLAEEGANVTVTLPGGDKVKGKIAEVGTVASTSDDDSDAPAGSGDGDGAAADATVDIIVAIADQKALRDLSGGPVEVIFVSETRKDVLAVPVGALLSLAEGGYGVEVVDGGKARIVAVDVGLFADGLVEVSGEGIAEGTVVGVAS